MDGRSGPRVREPRARPDVPIGFLSRTSGGARRKARWAKGATRAVSGTLRTTINTLPGRPSGSSAAAWIPRRRAGELRPACPFVAKVKLVTLEGQPALSSEGAQPGLRPDDGFLLVVGVGRAAALTTWRWRELRDIGRRAIASVGHLTTGSPRLRSRWSPSTTSLLVAHSAGRGNRDVPLRSELQGPGRVDRTCPIEDVPARPLKTRRHIGKWFERQQEPHVSPAADRLNATTAASHPACSQARTQTRRLPAGEGRRRRS